MSKQRLDALLVEQGFYETRSKAQAAIMAGLVLVNDLKVDKPGTQVADGVKVKIIGNKLPYVSRGGLKLEKALKVFPVSMNNKVVADIGASTGGFTDCMLQNGARKSSPAFFLFIYASYNPSPVKYILAFFMIFSRLNFLVNTG